MTTKAPPKQQQQPHQPTASSTAETGGGLVQKLFFPGYTNSGASDAFAVKPAATPNPNTSTTDDDEPTPSEAETDIYDNRSAQNIGLRQPQAQQSTNPHSTAMPQILPRLKASGTNPVSPPRRTVPPLFASTQPPRPTPSSPPKVARKPMTVQERSLSNTVLVDGQEEHGNEIITTMGERNRSTSVSSTGNDDRQQSIPQQLTPKNPSTTKQPTQVTDDSAPTKDNDDDDMLKYDSEHKEGDLHHPNVHKEVASPIISTPMWEEEATPAQTKFAKDVIFRHRSKIGEDNATAKLNTDDDEDDVSSTASEMGTVIGEARLQDLDRDLVEQNQGSGTDKLQSSATDQELYSKSVWPDTKVDPQSPSSHAVQRDDFALEGIRRTDSGLSAEASHRLTQAIRRIGSGLSSNKNHHRTSRSTPSTPRPRSLSTTEQDNWTSAVSPRTPTSSRPQQQSSMAPSSFLLRSPGSAAFCEAKSSHSGKKAAPASVATSTAPTRTHHALLSPRFWSVPPSIDEQEESAGGGPALPELQSRTVEAPSSSAAVPHSPIHPLQMAARACFSFDAYYNDTADDREDPYTEFRHQPVSNSHRNGSNNRLSSQSSRQKRYTTGKTSTQVLQSSQSWDGRWGMTTAGTSRNQPSLSETKDQPDVEREDALDLLACIVERGMTLPNQDQPALLDETTVARLRETTQQDPALEQVLRSHEYAVEMSRASHSAAAWLKSIGRGSQQMDERKTKAVNIDDSLITHAGSESLSAGDDINENSMDVVTVRSLLVETQKELSARTNQMEELNQELAKCRAEIGRLKTQQQQQKQPTPFQSPNRSILDDPNEEEDDDDDEDTEEIPENRSDSYLDRSFPSRQPLHHPSLYVDTTGELDKYKQALEEANQRIKKLHEKNSGAENGEADKPAPVVTVQSFPAPPSPGNTADTLESMDADNFETQWSELLPPLPPPPDHGLKSPIVETVLDAWTPETGLHQSLYEWMELVLSGSSPDDIPPLAISNLESQVRDGLVMHVLPLLLRRADVRVEVQTRTLRRTTYDLAVSIESTSTPLMDIPMRRRNWENFALRSDTGVSVTHSSVTALMDNQRSRQVAQAASAFRDRGGDPVSEVDEYYGPESPDRRLSTSKFVRKGQDATAPMNSGFSYDEMTEDLSAHGSSHPPGLMSALGDAIGGLMLRRPTPREAASPAMATVVGSHLPEAERFRTALQSEEKKAKQQLDAETELKADEDDTNRMTPKASNNQQHQQQGGGALLSSTNTTETPFQSPPLVGGTITNARSSSVDKSDNRVDDKGDEDIDGMAQQEVVDQSYHRVVSAPPGRIGVTFVEFRGHAMVSDVAKDSPLEGWMFPSDILIAIDELPVSGMRVRDIIQILRDRVDSQRALRVISCHAMDEFGFSLNTSHVSSVGEATG